MLRSSLTKKINTICLLCFLCVLWFISPPLELSASAWHITVVFIGCVSSIIIDVLPVSVIALVSIVVCVLTGLFDINYALKSFASSTVWLVMAAFLIARSFIKTGLGKRIAYYAISKFGSNVIGLAYGLLASEFIMAPAIPSASARGGGIIFPIAKALISEYETTNENEAQDKSDGEKNTHGSIAKFLIMICFHGNIITSAMFLTAVAANPIAIKLAARYGVEITWSSWMIGAIIPGLCSLLLLPIILYFLCKPSSTSLDIKSIATKNLKEMGRLSWAEKITAGVFVMLILLWSLESVLKINATTTAMLGLIVLLLTNVLTWSDALKEHAAWDTFVWFSILMTLASSLDEAGVINTLTHGISDWLHGKTAMFLPLLTVMLAFFYAHYFFASVTVHVTVMYSAFLTVLIHAGIPPMMSAMSLAFMSVLSAGLTHYGINTAPILFGGGYMSVASWWRVSGITTTGYLVIWAIVGSVWWRLIGWM